MSDRRTFDPRRFDIVVMRKRWLNYEWSRTGPGGFVDRGSASTYCGALRKALCTGGCLRVDRVECRVAFVESAPRREDPEALPSEGLLS